MDNHKWTIQTNIDLVLLALSPTLPDLTIPVPRDAL
jgi:hypothetical protein